MESHCQRGHSAERSAIQAAHPHRDMPVWSFFSEHAIVELDCFTLNANTTRLDAISLSTSILGKPELNAMSQESLCASRSSQCIGWQPGPPKKAFTWTPSGFLSRVPVSSLDSREKSSRLLQRLFYSLSQCATQTCSALLQFKFCCLNSLVLIYSAEDSGRNSGQCKIIQSTMSRRQDFCKTISTKCAGCSGPE